MWAWLKSPQGSTMTATAVAAILALVWVAPWSKPLPHVPGLPQMAVAVPPSSTAEPSVAPAAPAAPPPAPSATSASTGAAVPPAAVPSPSPAPPAPAAMIAPSFDVVRVEPSGATIIAGRGEPGSTVTLLDGGQVVAHVVVDSSGQFALLPPDLAEGSHYLTLQSSTPGAVPAVSPQGVAIAVPKAGATNRPMVAMLSPDQAVQVLSDGAPADAAAAAGAAAMAQPVAIQAVEAARGGKFTASGVAKAGSQSRLYLNGAFLAEVTADKDGRWSVRVEKGMRPGQYVVRVDQLEGGSGKVTHRAEVPFTYPAALGNGLGKQLLMARAGGAAAPGAKSLLGVAGLGGTKTPGANGQLLASAAPGIPSVQSGAATSAAVVSDLKLTTVSRGDSLWRISRKLLGRGMDYTEIYASNTKQIRNPSLIYPGQIFVLPQRPPQP